MPQGLGEKTGVRALAIFIAIALVYWPSLRGGWLWDDTQLIQNNLLTHDPGGWWKIWLEPGRLIDFQPITATIFWLEWHCFGDDTLGYHVVNLLLHAAGSLLVWRLFARLRVRAAWLGGLIFAVHPVLVESVAWIAELKNVLSLPPFLLGAIAWIDFSASGDRRDYRRALGFYLVALLCKATVIMFPAVILLHAWWRRGRIERRDLLASGPFFALSLLFGALTIWFLQRHGMERPALPPLGGFWTRVAGAGLIYALYFWNCLWPLGLSPVYPQWQVDPTVPFPYLVWVMLGVALGGFWLMSRTWGRHALFGLGFFTINLLPFLGFTGASYMAFTWAMDHILYLPVIGLIGLAAAGWGELALRLTELFRLCLIGCTAVLIAMLGWKGNSYAHVFQDSETLWDHTLERNPRSWIAHANLAQELERQGRKTEAMSHYEEAVALRPHDATLHCNIGKIFDEMGQPASALEEYRRALEIDPRSAIAHCNRGVVYTQLGRLPDAMANYKKALEIQPDYPEAESDLGVVLAESGRPEEAIGHYRNAIELNPDYAVAHTNLGDALGETGHLGEALEQYRQVLRLSPRDAEAHFNSGVALAALGRVPEAIAEYRAALRIDPRYAHAQANLEALQRRAGNH